MTRVQATVAAGDGKRNYNPVALLQVLHRAADFHHLTHEGSFSFRYFPDRIHGRGELQHSTRRHRGRVGLWTSRPVCDQERLPPWGGASDCH